MRFSSRFFAVAHIWLPITICVVAMSPVMTGQEPQPPPAPPAPVPVAPDLPVAAIDVTDVSGRPVTDSVDTSKLLIVSSSKAVRGNEVGSLLWIVDADPPAIIEHWTTDDGATLIVNTGTTPTNLKLLQIAAKGDRAAYQRILIKIGQGDIPPPVPPGPGPGPGPEPKPSPSPTPTADKLSLSVLADPLRVPVSQAMLLNERELWKQLPKTVWPRRDWSIKDPSPRAVELIDLAAKRGVPVPALIIDDAATGKNLDVVPLPETIDLLRSLLGRYVTP